MMRSWLLRSGLTVACCLLAVSAFAQVPASPTQPPPAPQPPATVQPPATAQPPAGVRTPAGETIRGRVVRTVAPDQFIIQTPDNREVTLYTSPQTRYLYNNQTGRWTDLRAGTNVNVIYTTSGDRWIASNVTWGTAVVPTQPPAPMPPEGTVVEGTVVRVVGPDQVVLRTTDGREVIVYVSPQTTYLNNNQPAVFTDIRPGANIGVNYDVRDRRFMARRVFWGPRR